MSRYEERECPLCGEDLKLNKKGVIKKKGESNILYVFSCEGCNQSFALDDDEQINYTRRQSSERDDIHPPRQTGSRSPAGHEVE